MATQPQLVRAWNGASDAISVNGYYTNFTVVSGKATNGAADGTTSLLGTDSTRSAQAVKGTFAIQDGAGLFCSAASSTSGVFFDIKYIGSETLFTLKTVDPAISNMASYYTNYIAETPMPSWMSSGTEYAFYLNVNTYGWAVSVAYGGGLPRVIMQLAFHDPVSGSRIPANDSNVYNMFGATHTKSGFVARKNGVNCRLLDIYSIGQFGDVYSGTRTVFSDNFSQAASGTYNPATATVYDSEKYTAVTTTAVNPTGSQASIPVVASPQTILQPPGTQPAVADSAITIISLDYISGQPCIKLSAGGALRHVYLNSDIASAGTFKAVTVVQDDPS